MINFQESKEGESGDVTVSYGDQHGSPGKIWQDLHIARTLDPQHADKDVSHM